MYKEYMNDKIQARIKTLSRELEFSISAKRAMEEAMKSIEEKVRELSHRLNELETLIQPDSYPEEPPRHR